MIHLHVFLSLPPFFASLLPLFPLGTPDTQAKERKKTKNGVARCHTVYIKYSIFFIVSSFLA